MLESHPIVEKECVQLCAALGKFPPLVSDHDGSRILAEAILLSRYPLIIAQNAAAVVERNELKRGR